MVNQAADLPNECWELVFKFLERLIEKRKFLIGNKDKKQYCHYLSILSLVSKQFLFITNHLRLSLAICDKKYPIFCSIFPRFPNLTSLHLIYCDLDKLDMSSIADCFPHLLQLYLNNSFGVSEVGICHVLRRCCNISLLNLGSCIGVKFPNLNFEVPKLEVLNLSYTYESVDDGTLYVISKSCPELLHLSLKHCKIITKKGVMCVVENCTKLREIDLQGCVNVDAKVVVSMVSSRPSLKKINIY